MYQLKIGHRESLLLAAAVVIAGLCVWRMAIPRSDSLLFMQEVQEQRPAPAFELYDQQSRLVKLNAFLHRHTIVLVFFDGAAGLRGGVTAETRQLLNQLRSFHSALERNGVIVVAVSNALPQQIRQEFDGGLPFPVLSDVTAGQPGSASLLWGTAFYPEADRAGRPAANDTGQRSVFGQAAGSARLRDTVFFIDRSGLVDWADNCPLPVRNPQLLINALVSGKPVQPG